MRIGLDITGALGGGGYRRYMEGLTRALARAAPEHDFFLCGVFFSGFPEGAKSLGFPEAPNVHWALRRFPQRLLFPLEYWLGLRVQERFLEPLNLDLFHGLGSILPRLAKLRSVVTLHYAGPWPFPSAWDRFYFGRLTERSVRSADKVIAVSEFSKREAIGEWGIAAEKIAVVPHGGPGEAFRPAPAGKENISQKRFLTAGAGRDNLRPAPPSAEKPAEIGGRYFLFVGATIAPKNPRLLAQAFRLAKRGGKIPHRLVFAGRPGPEDAWLRESFRAWGLESECVFLGPIDPSRIQRLYQQADAVICPSLHEGFAFPVIEAMACGAPVIAARAGALPETVGGAGLLADPVPEAFARAMIQIAEGRDGVGERLRAAGLERAKAFSWDETARKTLSVYREVAQA